MTYLQHKEVDEYLNHKSKTELSLETQVFLSFKHRTPNRYKLWTSLLELVLPQKKNLLTKLFILGKKLKSYLELY